MHLGFFGLGLFGLGFFGRRGSGHTARLGVEGEINLRPVFARLFFPPLSFDLVIARRRSFGLALRFAFVALRLVTALLA